MYIHIPFCKQRCHYCAFTSYTDKYHLIESYINAVHHEIQIKRAMTQYCESPQTLYIGGGTPSIISSSHISHIIENVGNNAIEITVEANPESVNLPWLRQVRHSGANRISLGIQSFQQSELHRLGRIHNAETAIDAMNQAKKAGFSNISVDLMYGIPGQHIDSWHDTIEKTIALEPDHISSYSLSIEEDSEFFNLFSNDTLLLPDPDETADMYHVLHETLAKHGYEWYEISNFARPGKESIHNSSYWNGTPYAGIGVSAHSLDGTVRSWNTSSIETYIETIESNALPISASEHLNDDSILTERIMLDLRTRRGLNLNRLNCTRQKLDSIRSYLDRLTRKAYITHENNAYILTVSGTMVSDEIVSDIISIATQ